MTDLDTDAVVGDLRLDATRWDSVSGEFSKAVTLMSEGATLPFGAFDGITHGLGATRAYADVLERLRTLLDGGVAETARIAEALRGTATNIESADREASGG
ncbi:MULTISPECIES: hypothetical protein [unclassified Microbacterium]|uniref:hypothetical protein n=1 Tax=unclassified Microbacterium TaxID=2609290 RepID=UPI0008F4A95F|nr:MULTISPECIES: hypothetical protein [unclassified Microbacterium]OIJ34402.1 hypothetical protein BK819_02640 [Microbacterium sp. LCT-H2]